MYVLDRATGEFLLGKPYVEGELDGRLRREGPSAQDRPSQPSKEGTLMRPHVHGATNWAPPSYSPKTGLFYVAHWEHSGIIAIQGEFPRGVGVNTAQTQMGQTNLLPFFNDDHEAYGVIRAYDPQTLDAKWEYKMADITWGGVLSTAGDVVFGGGKEGYFVALDARTGKQLWRLAVGGPDQQRADELLGRRQAVRHGRGGQLAVRVRVAVKGLARTTKNVRNGLGIPGRRVPSTTGSKGCGHSPRLVCAIHREFWPSSLARAAERASALALS